MRCASGCVPGGGGGVGGVSVRSGAVSRRGESDVGCCTSCSCLRGRTL